MRARLLLLLLAVAVAVPLIPFASADGAAPTWRIDFQAATSAPVGGYLADYGQA